MALNDAAEQIAREIEAIAQWETELLTDLEETRKRRERLQKSLSVLYSELVPHRRAALKQRMTNIHRELRLELRSKVHITDKVDAVHRFLAKTDGIVSVREVQKFLEHQKLTTHPDAASIILSRKVKQGVVTRVSRGRYRVNRGHPNIATV